MCWNERVSLNTYIVAVFGTVFAISNGFPINVIAWLHVFSLIQLVEYFIWKNLDDPEWNQLFSLVGLLAIVLEPITSIFLMDAGQLRDSFLACYVLFILSILYLYYPWTPYSKVAANKHLEWVWWPPVKTWTTVYILCGIWLFFYIVPPVISKHYILAVFAVVTFVISLITYSMANTRGSMWCWLANGTWLIIIGFIAADKCFEDMWCKK